MPTRSSLTRRGTSCSTFCRCPVAGERPRRGSEWSDDGTQEADRVQSIDRGIPHRGYRARCPGVRGRGADRRNGEDDRRLREYSDAPDYGEGRDPRRDDPAKAGFEDREVLSRWSSDTPRGGCSVSSATTGERA